MQIAITSSLSLPLPVLSFLPSSSVRYRPRRRTAAAAAVVYIQCGLTDGRTDRRTDRKAAAADKISASVRVRRRCSARGRYERWGTENVRRFVADIRSEEPTTSLKKHDNSFLLLFRFRDWPVQGIISDAEVEGRCGTGIAHLIATRPSESEDFYVAIRALEIED